MQFLSSARAAPKRTLFIAALVLAALMVAGIVAGGTSVDWSTLLAGDAAARTIVFDLRAPRVVLAALAGAGLAVSGAMMQALFRNPLADPALIGVSSGAALGALTAIVLGAGLTSLPGFIPVLPLSAFAGALLATGLLLAFAHRDTVSTLLLAGIAFNALAGAAVGALTWLASDAHLRSLTFWLLGSFGSADWPLVLGVAPLLLLPVLAAPRLAPALNALLLGEIEAGYLGFATRKLKFALVALAALAVGAAVAAAGIVGFIGLMVPHIVRALTGPDHRHVLAGSALLPAWSKPVAITVIFTFPVRFGSITAPKMMLASSCAASWITHDASLTSRSDRSGPPVTLMMTPRAPCTESSSRSGLEIARLAACMARSSPSATPVPIMATPVPAMIVRTSAKSRLMSPGTRIRSEMP